MPNVFTSGGAAETESVIITTQTTPDSTTASTLIWSTWNEKRIKTSHDSFGGGTGQIIWSNWCDHRYQSTASTTTRPWPVWIDVHRRTESATTDKTWVLWNRAPSPHDVQISDEEYQARRARNEAARLEREARYRAESLERERAKERASILLQEHLTDEQKAELADKRYFTLATIDSATGERRTYRIHQGRAGNVEQVDDNGRRLKRLCIHPNIACPDEDTMLAQKLWLETREAEFLRIANHS